MSCSNSDEVYELLTKSPLIVEELKVNEKGQPIFVQQHSHYEGYWKSKREKAIVAFGMKETHEVPTIGIPHEAEFIKLLKDRYGYGQNTYKAEYFSPFTVLKGYAMHSTLNYMKITKRSKISHYIHKFINFFMSKYRKPRGIITPEIAAGRHHSYSQTLSDKTIMEMIKKSAESHAKIP